MGFTVLIWVAIIIIWSVKTASDQKKRNQRRPNRPVDDTESSKRGVYTEQVPSESRYARHERRLAEEAARRNGTIEKAVDATIFVEASSPETNDTLVITELTDTPFTTPKATIPTPKADKPQSAGTENPLGEPFDLRRAVIYSEILKPKFEE